MRQCYNGLVAAEVFILGTFIGLTLAYTVTSTNGDTLTQMKKQPVKIENRSVKDKTERHFVKDRLICK
jgi:hypothetical protein